MPEHSGPEPRKPISPVMFPGLANPDWTKSFQASIAAMTARAGEPFVADLRAKLATTFAGFTPSVPAIPLSVLRPPVVTSNAALAYRLEDALDRNTTAVVSTIATSVAPVATDVASIAKPRGWGKLMQIGVGVSVAATIVAAVFSVLTYLATTGIGH
jgi:hypothetical protein